MGWWQVISQCLLYGGYLLAFRWFFWFREKDF